MFTKTKIALAAALVLGSGVAALANEIETNPSTAQSDREWATFLGKTDLSNPGTAYGYSGVHQRELNKKNSGR
jgi:hypothetical protein